MALRERAKHLAGILNGVDNDVLDPRRDIHLPATFGPGRVSGKLRCKAHVQEELDLATTPDVPLIIWISRTTDQKMADTALEIAAPCLALRHDSDRSTANWIRAAAP